MSSALQNKKGIMFWGFFDIKAVGVKFRNLNFKGLLQFPKHCACSKPLYLSLYWCLKATLYISLFDMWSVMQFSVNVFSILSSKLSNIPLSMIFLVKKPHLLFLLQLFRSTRFVFILTVPKILDGWAFFRKNPTYTKCNVNTSLSPHIPLYFKQTAHNHSPTTLKIKQFSLLCRITDNNNNYRIALLKHMCISWNPKW